MKSVFVCTVVAAATLQAQQAKPDPSLPPCGLPKQEIVARLNSSINTVTARVGDAFTTSVVSPAELADGMIEGRIVGLQKPEAGFGKGKPSIQLTFTRFIRNGTGCALSAELRQVTNSKGVKNVDEEGRAVGRTSNGKRALGAFAGAVLGGGIAAASGASAGTIAGATAAGTAVGFVLTSTVTSAGGNIEFQPGSVFTLQTEVQRGNRP